jgi:hypothetical protein
MTNYIADAAEGVAKFIDGLVRPAVTGGLVAAIVYLGVVQGSDEAVSTILNLGIAVVSFWFGTRTADKAADAAIAAAKESTVTTTTPPSSGAVTATTTTTKPAAVEPGTLVRLEGAAPPGPAFVPFQPPSSGVN